MGADHSPLTTARIALVPGAPAGYHHVRDGSYIRLTHRRISGEPMRQNRLLDYRVARPARLAGMDDADAVWARTSVATAGGCPADRIGAASAPSLPRIPGRVKPCASAVRSVVTIQPSMPVTRRHRSSIADSRPAELFLRLAGGTYRPEAYKIGLAACCLAVPLLLFAAACAMNLGQGASCLGVTVGLLIWWGPPCRDLLEAGDLDLLLAGLAGLTQLAFLVRFDREPGPWGWAAVLASGCLGWFAQPALFSALLPLLLIYYASVGGRHALIWHLAFVSARSRAVSR